MKDAINNAHYHHLAGSPKFRSIADVITKLAQECIAHKEKGETGQITKKVEQIAEHHEAIRKEFIMPTGKILF